MSQQQKSKNERLFEKSIHKRAICIDDKPPSNPEFFAANGWLRKDRIYHVLSANDDGLFQILGKPVWSDEGKAGWNASRFRMIA